MGGEKLGHMNEKCMKVLHSKKVLLGVKCVNMDFCESCMFGKKKRVSFVKRVCAGSWCAKSGDLKNL